jgi:hypothetical protein
MRIVADPNTLASGFGRGGPPGQVVDTVLSGQVTLVISPALLGELARVLAYPKLAAVFRAGDEHAAQTMLTAAIGDAESLSPSGAGSWHAGQLAGRPEGEPGAPHRSQRRPIPASRLRGCLPVQPGEPGPAGTPDGSPSAPGSRGTGVSLISHGPFG